MIIKNAHDSAIANDSNDDSNDGDDDDDDDDDGLNDNETDHESVMRIKLIMTMTTMAAIMKMLVMIMMTILCDLPDLNLNDTQSYPTYATHNSDMLKSTLHLLLPSKSSKTVPMRKKISFKPDKIHHREEAKMRLERKDITTCVPGSSSSQEKQAWLGCSILYVDDLLTITFLRTCLRSFWTKPSFGTSRRAQHYSLSLLFLSRTGTTSLLVLMSLIPFAFYFI